MSEVYVLGGAGFIGSAVARAFARQGDRVTVVDGFLPRTGANGVNLEQSSCTILRKRVEDMTQDERAALAQADVIVDAMAWTSHLDAVKDPAYDLALNVASHLSFLSGFPENSRARLIYLGSRGQYGRSCEQPIREGSKMMPDDIQGIHKTTADHYFRVFSKLKHIRTVCLRFPNCYGTGQKRTGNDIGLIGGFIRDALADNEIEVFGENRYRNIVFSEDVARCVVLLSRLEAPGYHDFNLSGTRINLYELAQKIVCLVGSGHCHAAPMPEKLSAIDMGDVPVCEDKLRKVIRNFTYTDLDMSLGETINYFRSAGKSQELN